MFHRKLIGVYLGQFAVASTLWFFLTWFPNYLTQEKGITALKAGFMTTVPFLAAFVGVLLSGWVADLLVRKGFSLGFARKTPIICGLLISTCIMGANYTNDPMMIMCLMALAFFGNGFASITWSLVSSLAPMRLIGLTGGVFNFAGGLGGITVPLVVGYLAGLRFRACTGLYLRRCVDWRALLHPAGGRCEARWLIFQLWNMRHTTAHNPLS